MGPGFGLILVMFAAIAAGITISLLLMPGWKSSLALLAAYAAVLGYVSLSPELFAGQMERATLGLGWVALILAGIIRATLFLVKRRSSR
jgi:hypothetical protein